MIPATSAAALTFLVVTVFGEPAVTVGPLPMDFAACQAKVNAGGGLEPFEAVWRSGKTVVHNGRAITRADVAARCERRPAQP